MAAYNLSKSYRRKALDMLTGQTGNTPGSTLGGPQTTVVPNANGATMQGRQLNIDPSRVRYATGGGIDPGFDLNSVGKELGIDSGFYRGASGQSLGIDPGFDIGATSASQASPTQSVDASPQASSGYDVNAAYDDIMKALKGSADASFANTQQQLYGQVPGINQNYDTLNSQAYSNARLSALGSNEALASQGLAGAPSAGPQSGYSETSHVAQDAALGNAINANNLARRNALDALTGQVNQAQTTRDASVLGQQGQVLQQKASALQNQDQFNRNLALQEAGLTGTYNGADTLAKIQADRTQALNEAGLTGLYNGNQTLEAQQLAAQQDQQKIDNAMNQVNLTGYVDAQTAAVLGLPVGTPSWQANQWKQEFDYTKQQNAKKSSGRASASDKDIADSYDATDDTGGANPASSLPTVAQLQQMGMPQSVIDVMRAQGRVRG